MSSDQTQYMVCLTLCLCNILGIGINIDTVRNASALTCLYILQPLLIILTGIIIPISTTDDHKIYIRIFYFIPIDRSIVITDVNSFCNRIRNDFTWRTDKIAVHFWPRIRSCSFITVSWHGITDQLTILIPPAVLSQILLRSCCLFQNFFLICRFFYLLCPRFRGTLLCICWSFFWLLIHAIIAYSIR